MDISFELMNSEGDHVMVALSYYDLESVKMFSSDPSVLTLVFYDVTLSRTSGKGYVGSEVLFAVSDALGRFLADNDDAVLCFYCDALTDVKRNHKDMLPQEYRSNLFSRMFELYTKSRNISHLTNERISIESSDDPESIQIVHFICRKCHSEAVATLGEMLKRK